MFAVGGSNENRTSKRDGFVRNAIGPVLILLALWFLYGPQLTKIPHHDAVRVAMGDVGTEPLRRVSTGEPAISAGGYALRCMECHRLFPSRADARRTIAQHTHIVLDHGLNDRCLNCHDLRRRDRLRLQSGETVAFAEVARSCADCHGTTYRDWQRGMHGRTNGYWDPTRGPQRRLKCIECHDPHAPALEPMVPLPGPRTLRVDPGAHAKVVHAESNRNPLRRTTSSDAPGSHGEPEERGSRGGDG